MRKKHGLSDEDLQAADPVSAANPSEHIPGKSGRARSCPACDHALTGAMDECPRCGIVISKVANKGRVGREHKSIHTYERTEAEAGNRLSWAAVAVTVVICLVLGVMLWKWSSSGIQRPEHAKLASGAAQTSAELKRFTYDNLHEDVVAASRKQPVLIEFYSDH